MRGLLKVSLFALAVSVLAHRMVLDPQAKFAGANGATLISALVRETKVPA